MSSTFWQRVEANTRPGRFFWFYVGASTIAIYFANGCIGGNGFCMFAALWGITGCLPWPFVLNGWFGIDPDHYYSVRAILLMSTLNALVLYVVGVLIRASNSPKS